MSVMFDLDRGASPTIPMVYSPIDPWDMHWARDTGLVAICQSSSPKDITLSIELW